MPKSRTPSEAELAAIREAFNYDPETGIVTWARWNEVVNGPCRREAGDEAGTLGVSGYRVVGLGKRYYKAHNVAWFLHHGVWPERELDHRDGVEDNNRMRNLRLAGDLNRVSRKVYENSVSGVRGVVQRPSGRWSARLRIAGKLHWLGTYDTAEAAGAAVRTLAIQVRGEFARVD